MTIWQILFYAAWCMGLYVHADSLSRITPDVTDINVGNIPDTGRQFNVLG